MARYTDNKPDTMLHLLAPSFPHLLSSAYLDQMGVIILNTVLSTALLVVLFTAFTDEACLDSSQFAILFYI